MVNRRASLFLSKIGWRRALCSTECNANLWWKRENIAKGAGCSIDGSSSQLTCGDSAILFVPAVPAVAELLLPVVHILFVAIDLDRQRSRSQLGFSSAASVLFDLQDK